MERYLECACAFFSAETVVGVMMYLLPSIYLTFVSN